MNKKDLVKIEVSVENVIFKNEENCFTVLETDYNGDLLCVVGEMLGVEPGELLALHGNFTSHPTYGHQFKVSAYERSLPATANAILKYLSSGAIKGIGPVIANRLVERFGDETLAVMEKDPDQLLGVKGISPKKATEIAKEFSRMFGIRTTMLYLSKYGIDTRTAILIWKKYGDGCEKTIEANPYILISQDIGLTFEHCDEIATKLGKPKNSLDRIEAACVHVLRHNTLNGHTCLPTDKLVPTVGIVTEIDEQTIIDCLEEALGNGDFFRENVCGREYIYLPTMYEAERYTAARLSFMLMTDVDTNGCYDKEIKSLEEKEGLVYAKKQSLAINEAMNHSLFILTGGPGTGKTTTINSIIALYEEQGMKVGLAAPTGRAAKRMSEVTGKEAKTIHRLLEVDPTKRDVVSFKRNEKNPLNYDVIIVDEMSMVDILIMQSLLRAIKMGGRLIMVGDSSQLPSVGAGNVLKDMIDSEKISTVELNEVFRQAAESLIITNAHSIVKGEMPNLDVKDKDFFFMYRSNYEKMISTVSDLCSTRLPKTYGFSPTNDIQVIAPTRVGPVGTTKLNEVLQQVLNPPENTKTEFKFDGTTFREGDKVMQTKNNYDIPWINTENEHGAGVFNGDIGTIDIIDKPTKTVIIKYDDKTANYDFQNMNEVEHAYAITVHKSQGSEFDAVIIPVMHHKSKMHYKNVLYTAVTRARKLLIIMGIQNTVYRMVENDRKTVRYTNLKDFLTEGAPS